ncbi:MAG: SpoIIE family protein phosphatase [Actinomycetota bacterium]|nr:SpoIIE family protein phosphatase [Actinomycetota bacterium]
MGSYEFYWEAELGASPGADKLRAQQVRRLLDLAVRSSVNGIVITDAALPDNPIVYVNPAFERTTGYSAKETLGRNCRFLQGDDRDQPVLDELRAALKEGRECRVVLRNYRKDGTSFWNELHVSPVYDEEGMITNFVGVQSDVTGRRKDEEERDFLLLREQIARGEAEAAKMRLGLLARAGEAISASLEHSAIVARVARLMIPEFADWCLVDILEEDGSLKQLAAAHADLGKEDLLRELGKYRELDADALRESRRLSSTVFNTGESVLLPEVDDGDLIQGSTDDAHLELLRRLAPRSYICVPLRARGRVLGTIVLVSSRESFRYDAEDLALAEDVARRCALAVDNARLYRGRSEIARALQDSLLPARFPEVPGVEVGLRYLPAGEVDVGGDFYDLFDARTEGDANPSWGVVIGDVVGKGAEAAAVLAFARYTIRAVAMRESCPTAILAGLNEAMLRQKLERDEHKFCTVAYLRLEADEAGRGVEISVSRGGHSAPLLLEADGGVSKIGLPGRAIGVFEDPNLTEQGTRLSPGDSLVLYTDGVVEARSPDGSFFGEERLASLLRSSIGLDAQTLADRVESAVLDFQENDPRDDIAVLVLRVPQ